MHKTFCPAKWDELFINPGYSYVYACCKSSPVKFHNKDQISTILDGQKNNLINGIQDPSCDYCWNLENQGFTSRRHEYLTKFKGSMDEYININPKAKHVEISLGNECNFQCVYCNPKFSSQWESDIKTKPYKIFSDKDFYSLDDKNPSDLDGIIKWLIDYNEIETLAVLGGEPLRHKGFFKLAESIPSRKLLLNTNLSCPTTAPIDQLLALAGKYETIYIGVSLDSTEKLAEFTRYGMDYSSMVNNIKYLVDRAPDNVVITIQSLMSSVTIRDLNNMAEFYNEIKEMRPALRWEMNYCHDPKIFTFSTLKDQYKSEAIENLLAVQSKWEVIGIELIIGAIKVAKFNNTLYNQMKHFLTEFSTRKNLKTPIDL